MEDGEARKARLAALRQAKAAATGQALPAASVPAVAATSSPAPVLGEKRRADSSAEHEQQREFDGDEEILDVEDLAESEISEPKSIKLRNYRPIDETVKNSVSIVPKAVPVTADAQIADILALAKQTASDPFLNIAPKKLNWDLKREVADKLDVLRKRTQKVINEIVAEKIKQQEEEEADEELDEESAEGQHSAGSNEIDLE